MDISHCGLTKVSRVITWMTCHSDCWTANGSDKIYKLTNNGFRVYLNQFGRQAVKSVFGGKLSALRAEYAQDKKFELHYEVKGICTDIPGSV